MFKSNLDVNARPFVPTSHLVVGDRVLIWDECDFRPGIIDAMSPINIWVQADESTLPNAREFLACKYEDAPHRLAKQPQSAQILWSKLLNSVIVAQGNAILAERCALSLL
tara:strand:- start:89 stop:418 length:330 start_codon:yes stop_codon:yes gene_type:complete